MSVYDDYSKSQWQKYFTDSFLQKHLRPHENLPAGGELTRTGNVVFQQRHAASKSRYEEQVAKATEDGKRVDNISKDRIQQNSIVYDHANGVRQILRLMNEVERRNTHGHFALDNRTNSADGHFITEDVYVVHVSTHGSRQQLVSRRIKYDVARINDPECRFVIVHLDDLVK